MPIRPLLPIAICGLVATPAAAQTVGGRWQVHHDLEGVHSGGQLGAAVCSAGDVDSDGRGDFVVSQPGGSGPAGFRSGIVQVLSGADARVIHEFSGRTPYEFLGRTLASGGDMDGDGVGEIVVGAPSANRSLRPRVGAVEIRSGATGALLHDLVGDLAGDYYGMAVGGAGDVDGDGIADFVAGAEFGNPGARYGAGYAQVHSGATGAVLHRFEGAVGGMHLGAAVDGAGDVDGDGFHDVLVGAPDASPNGRYEAGSVFVYSGRTGAVLREFHGAAPEDHFGISVAGCGDVDGDGIGDVLFGALTNRPGAVDAGSVFVHSGAGGALLHRFDGESRYEELGSTVADAGDVDGDGVPDFVFAAPGASPVTRHEGSVFLRSGATGCLLRQIDGHAEGMFLGQAVAGAGDLSGDGRADVVLGAPLRTGAAWTGGAAFVHGFEPFLTHSHTEVSLAAGAVVRFELDFGPDDAGAPYAMLASERGVGPHVRDGVLVPLSIDELYLRCATGDPPGAFSEAFGSLDPLGRASVSLTFPPGMNPGFVGRQRWFAAVTFDPSQTVRRSSVAASILLVP